MIDDKQSNSTVITIKCDTEPPNFDPKIILELTLICPLPNISYTEYLSTLNIPSLTTLNLKIEPSKNNLSLTPNLFHALNVTKLVIDYKYVNNSGIEDFIEINSNVLYVLNEVEELSLKGVAVVENNPEVNNIVDTCSRLRVLRISISDLRLVPAGWLEACRELVHLHLNNLRQRNSRKAVRKVLSGAKRLRKLEIVNCFIDELEDELQGLDKLEYLNVAHNQIHNALTTVILPNLLELDLSHNHISSSALLSSGIEKQPRLRVLNLDYNTVLDICDDLPYRTTYIKQNNTAVAKVHHPLNRRPLNLNSIQRLSLRGTITTTMCFSHLNMDALEYFDLSDSKISKINFQALPRSKARRLELNLSGCPIRDIPGFSFSEEDYQLLHHEELRITGLNVTLQCDCEEYLWLAKASRERKLILNGAICSYGLELATISDDKLQCSKYKCGACTCRKYWQENATDVECRGELHAIPKEPGIRRLFASGNMVENVTADIPDTLIYLDLSKNHIARMSEDASVALFANPERRVRMFGNPIICDCENRPYIQALMDHFDRVEDYTSLTCIDDGRLVRDVDPFELCYGSSRQFHTTLTASLGALVGVTAMMVGLYYRFGKAAKVYLYSKGLCLFCIREDQIDADREYDAFVSFSHKDEDFVTHNLLPGLEGDPYNFKLCLHYRNWIAGELIPAQINQSIGNSKRTIVVLSKSFLDSLWGLLEFRTAHLSALKEGRTRLIIVVIDDILETRNLDGELRSYLRTNTYVKWGDPWFWDKLRYALPHKTALNRVQIKIDPTKETDVLEEVNSLQNVAEETGKNREDTQKHQNATISEHEYDNPSFEKLEDSSGESCETKDNLNYLNVVSPAERQISNDSAIEMENFSSR
ncbi:hypothetical protein O0L34_g16021 [Tuta absoluta]|nr:hypothetical protein O0L34_g16021 [Tuta absoluta]